MIVSPRVGSRSSSDETEIRSPDPVSPCDAIDETLVLPVSSCASLGAGVTRLCRHPAPFPCWGADSAPLFVCCADGHFAQSLAPTTVVDVRPSSLRASAVWRLRVDTCRLVLAPTYSRFSYTEGPAVDGSKYLSLLVSTCGRGRYVGKVEGVSLWSYPLYLSGVSWAVSK